MKTIIKKEIDGYQVIVGVDKPIVDPAKTKPILREEIEKSSEHSAYLTIKSNYETGLKAEQKKVDDKRNQLQIDFINNELEVMLRQTDEYKAWEAEEDEAAKIELWKAVAIKKIELARAGLNVNALLLQSDEYAAFVDFQKTEGQKVRDAWQAVLNKQKEITETMAVYFTPRDGEMIVEDEEAEAVLAELDALPANKALIVGESGRETIDDYRRVVYWLKDELDAWSKTEITALGDAPPAGAVPEKSLTVDDMAQIQEQLEAERISALSEEAKTAEFDAGLASALTRSAIKRSEFEIQGVEPAQALADATALYQDEEAALRLKYDIQAS